MTTILDCSRRLESGGRLFLLLDEAIASRAVIANVSVFSEVLYSMLSGTDGRMGETAFGAS